MRLILSLMICIMLILGTMLGLSACGGSEQTISGTGTIKFVDLEGGFYGIEGSDGQRYEPVNLGNAYKIDNLPITFEVKLRPDLASIYMWGTPVEIINIAQTSTG